MSIEQLNEKWSPVLEHADLPSITDPRRKATVAQLLENTERALAEGSAWSTNSYLAETPTNAGLGLGQADSTSNIAAYDPVLISLVRRAMPNLIAYDIAGVQPMTGPTGLIFAMRSKYVANAANNQTWTENFYNEVNTAYAGTGTQAGNTGTANTANNGVALSTGAAEALGSTGSAFAEMAFTIEKVQVIAKTRALKAEYTSELAQDLKAIHGLDAESELANILTTEILAEINREVVRTIYNTAVTGANTGTATQGVFDLDVDSNGRWSVEKYKGLMMQIEREANQIAKSTRRGKGNIVICSSDVASALQMAGNLSYTPALDANRLEVDDTGNTFAGILNGRYRVYIDPYAGGNYAVVGYKGSNSFDAGLFYCPYVPLQMVRAVGQDTFQPKIGFKTRYGMVANPFAEGANVGLGELAPSTNQYYRRLLINNIL
jgi:hypothetical protein